MSNDVTSTETSIKQLVEEHEDLHEAETEYEFSNDRDFVRYPYDTSRGVYAE